MTQIQQCPFSWDNEDQKQESISETVENRVIMRWRQIMESFERKYSTMLKFYMKLGNKVLISIFIYVTWKANMRCLDHDLTVITYSNEYIGSPFPSPPLFRVMGNNQIDPVYIQRGFLTPTEVEAQIYETGSLYRLLSAPSLS